MATGKGSGEEIRGLQDQNAGTSNIQPDSSITGAAGQSDGIVV